MMEQVAVCEVVLILVGTSLAQGFLGNELIFQEKRYYLQKQVFLCFSSFVFNSILYNVY